MAIERRSFRLGIAAGVFLVAGALIGVLLTARMDWVSPAESNAPALIGAEQIAPLVNGPRNDFVPVVKRTSPAVVNISTTRVVKQGENKSPFMDDPFFRHFFGDEFMRRFNGPRKRQESALGSGVIVDAKGYIVTNNHVIAKADEIKVVLSDDREFEGKVVGTDPKTDLAVIKIDGKDLPALSWGDSDKLDVGEYVLAIGNPFGLNQTITMGIVSAVGRANVGIADYEDFIQTDAAINPGNSGGALVNSRGELIGINTAIFSRSGGYMGIGFAVPSNMVRTVMSSLVKDGKVTRGWLGVSIQNVNKDLAEQFDLKNTDGALVNEVMNETPAEKGGVEAGDVIVEFDGKKVRDTTELRNIVAATPVGKPVKVVVIRDSKRKTLTIKIDEQPKDMRAQAQEPEAEVATDSPLAGVEVTSLNAEMSQELGIDQTSGVVVTGVHPDSAAQAAGLRRGDVILSIQRTAVRNIADYNKLVAKLGKKDKVLLRIKRRGGKVFIIVKP